MKNRMGNQLQLRGWVTVTCLALLVSGADASAAKPEWKVGLAQVKITPERPVRMSGYAARTKLFEKVAADLYGKALVLEARKGQRGVLVTSDLLGFPAAVAEPICVRIQKKTGLKREQILLNSSHTHAGPALSLKAPAKEDPGAGEALRTVEYTRQLQNKVIDVVVRAAWPPRPWQSLRACHPLGTAGPLTLH